jgi:glutamate formiminotransferase
MLDEISRAFSSVPSAQLLHIDSNSDANRTVFTLAGSPDGVAAASLAGARAIHRLIDMSRHTGVHPRIGALDVLPFVPLSGCSMADCAALARDAGRRIADELSVPVFFYGEAALRPERRELSFLRKGGYEALPEKLADPAWLPDAGPNSFLPRWGATACGAREVLVAWNLNLDRPDLGLARDIAADLRGAGGAFPGLKAIGWLMDRYGLAQVSLNVTDFRSTPLAAIYAEARRSAERRGARVTGSELIGLIPLAALIGADSAAAGPESAADIAAAVKGLGLASLRPFVPETRILEFALGALGKG